MAYIVEGPGPVDWENVKPGETFTIDLWRDYTDSKTLFEWYERDTKEGRDLLVGVLLARGHEFPPEEKTPWFSIGDRVKTKRDGLGTIIAMRTIDIGVHPITGEETDSHSYRVELDEWTTDDPLERLIGKSPQFYANEIKLVERS